MCISFGRAGDGDEFSVFSYIALDILSSGLPHHFFVFSTDLPDKLGRATVLCQRWQSLLQETCQLVTRPRTLLDTLICKCDQQG